MKEDMSKLSEKISSPSSIFTLALKRTMKFISRTLRNSLSQGFTLIELLMVVVIISTLAVVVFVALNPAKRISDSKDARRTTDVDSILTAIHTYIVDNNGDYPAGLSASMPEVHLGTDVSNCEISTGGCTVSQVGCLDLSTPLATYLKSMPIDPSGGTTYTDAKSGYSVEVDANGIVTVRACGAEGTTQILSSR